MALNIQQILTCMQLPDFGRDNTRAIVDYALKKQQSVNNAKELSDLIDHCFDIEVIDNIPEYDSGDFDNAQQKAEQIVNLCRQKRIGITVRGDDKFPRQLLNVKQGGKETAPALLYYIGCIEQVNERRAIAIIGSRQTTPEGMADGRHFAQYAASKGLNVVSGLAVGADTAAHEGALLAHGMTTAILAFGLNQQSHDNSSLQARIARADGLLLSEYAPNATTTMLRLIQRDRLQAGLADATLLIQSNIKKGGSMHAVNTSIENGKPVFAVDYRNTRLADNSRTQQNRVLIEQNKAIALTRGNEKLIDKYLIIK